MVGGNVLTEETILNNCTESLQGYEKLDLPEIASADSKKKSKTRSVPIAGLQPPAEQQQEQQQQEQQPRLFAEVRLGQFISIRIDEENTDALKELQRLVFIDMSANDLRSLDGLNGVEFPDLRFVDTSDNLLTDCSGLLGFATLRKLILSNNQITLLPRRPHWPHLRSLDVSSNELTSLAGVESLPALEELNAACNNIATLPPGIASLKRLNRLVLAGNKIETLAPLSRIDALRYLDASRNQLDDLQATVRVLKSLLNLRVLLLLDNPISREAPYLPSLMDLQGITEVDCVAVTESNLRRVVAETRETSIEELIARTRIDYKERVEAMQREAQGAIRSFDQERSDINKTLQLKARQAEEDMNQALKFLYDARSKGYITPEDMQFYLFRKAESDRQWAGLAFAEQRMRHMRPLRIDQITEELSSSARARSKQRAEQAMHNRSTNLLPGFTSSEETAAAAVNPSTLAFLKTMQRPGDLSASLRAVNTDDDIY